MLEFKANRPALRLTSSDTAGMFTQLVDGVWTQAQHVFCFSWFPNFCTPDDDAIRLHHQVLVKIRCVP